MEFAILGPLRVGAPGGAIELKASKQRALLAMLLVSYRDEAVPTDRLVDALWGEAPPATAVKALQVYISQLRRALGPEQAIVTRPGGYAIALAPGELDLERFETLVERAAGAPAAQAAELLREALGLFRGEPLADAPLLGPGAAEADRIAGARLAALEQRIEHDLALGRHAAVASELEALAVEHPYRERLHAQLMLALYRCGRQADALDAYRRVRGNLVDDLGLDPGRELRELEAAVLAHEPSLELDRAAAAAPRAPAPAAPALPVPATELLGRDDDVATAAAQLADPGIRLLTLTGPGGIGKTRLGLELAHRLGPNFADGARFVTLGTLEDPASVVPELARALGATESEAQSPFETLSALLADRSILLVVDNFEQVIDAGPELGRVLAASPGSKFVVTSRAPLRVAAEHEFAIGPLAAAPAVELFLRRARAVDARLALDTGDEQRIERICARLDGLPLAIELAAARVKVLAPAAILDRLAHRLDLLSAGPRDSPARQQTLRGAIGWSYDLLDAPARQLFCELGVFAGGFSLEAAESVCGHGALDGIAALVDQSLVTRDADRFGMLETVREYALERLTAAGELEAVRDRHARAFTALTEDAESGLHGPELPQWLRMLDADRDNIRAALRHAIARGDADIALGLTASVWRHWVTRGELTEGRALATAALASGAGPPMLRLRAANGAGIMAGEQGDFAASREHFEESMALARQIGARGRLSRATSNLANLAMYEGDFETAIRRYEEGMATARALGDDRALSLVLQNLGIAHGGAGHRERAIELLEESLEIALRAADPAHLTSAQRSLARILLDEDSARALPLLQESLTRSYELADRNAIVEALETASAAAGGRGDPHTGALLMGAAGALRAAAGAIRQPDEEAWAAQAETTLRSALGEDAFAAALADGAQLGADDAVARALAI